MKMMFGGLFALARCAAAEPPPIKTRLNANNSRRAVKGDVNEIVTDESSVNFACSQALSMLHRAANTDQQFVIERPAFA